MKLDWEHYLETGKFRMVESSDRAECGCKHCTVNKRFYKRQDTKKARRESKALVCYESTNPEVVRGEPRVVLQDRRGYTSVDEYYFENFIMPDWYDAQDFHIQHMAEGKYTSQSEDY